MLVKDTQKENKRAARMYLRGSIAALSQSKTHSADKKYALWCIEQASTAIKSL